MRQKRLSAFILGMLLAGTSMADPNDVYIEQLGNANSITIEQVGIGNKVGGVAGELSINEFGVRTMTAYAPSVINYATLNGNNNQLIITQHGDNNTEQYSIFGNDNSYISWLLGDANQILLKIGDVEQPVNLRNSLTEWISGSNNLIIQELRGNDIVDNITITGSNNQVVNQFFSSRAVNNNTVVGNHNVINSQQTDTAGALGHSLTMDTIGDFNSITTQQQGFEDTNINIQTVGNDNTITVRTSSSAIVAPATAIMR